MVPLNVVPSCAAARPGAATSIKTMPMRQMIPLRIFWKSTSPAPAWRPEAVEEGRVINEWSI
jgi:hypothetical protein